MGSTSNAKQHPQSLDICEEAVELIRAGGWTLLAKYYVGAIPFIGGLIFFWTDMSRSPTAEERLPAYSLAMTLLFVWLKFWQCMFATGLREQLFQTPSDSLNAMDLSRTVVYQTLLQSTSFIALPLAIIFFVPLPWVYAFYQAATAIPIRDQTSLRQVWRQSGLEAMLWPLQNHVILGVLGVLTLFVMVDIAVVLRAIPWILTTLFGLETPFSLTNRTFLNSTFLFVIGGATFLVVDPVFKAVFVLRSFYGSSRESAVDLQLGLKRAQNRRSGMISLAVFCGVMVFSNGPLRAEEADHPAQTAFSSQEAKVDEAIDHVLKGPEFQWRMEKKEKASVEKSGWFYRFLHSVGGMIKKTLSWLGKMIGKIVDWFFKDETSTNAEPWSWNAPAQLMRLLVVVLCLLLVIGIGWAAIRFQKRKNCVNILKTEALEARPIDVMDEKVSADQMPENDWLRLAKELVVQGEYRKALRAFLLADLAHLGERQFVSLARFKSNHEYERELERRTRGTPLIAAAFSEIVAIYDRAWYGNHEVSQELLSRFEKRTMELMNS